MKVEVGKVYTNTEGKFRKVIEIKEDRVYFVNVDDCGIPDGTGTVKYLSEFERWAVAEHDPAEGERAKIR